MSLVVLQVDSLAERVEELKQDKKRLVDEYEAKLSKVPGSIECNTSFISVLFPCQLITVKYGVTSQHGAEFSDSIINLTGDDKSNKLHSLYFYLA